MRLRIIGIVLIIVSLGFGAIYGSKYLMEYLRVTNEEGNIALEQEAREVAEEAKEDYLENLELNGLGDGKVRIVDNDVVAKLTIDACNIDTLVYENEEDNYYLRRNSEGKNSNHGEIYTNCYDCDVPIIYGHHMKDGTMFAGLDVAYCGAEITLEDIGFLEDRTRTYVVTAVYRDIPANEVWEYIDVIENGLILITCSYGVDDGRLVVVAKEGLAD